MSPQYTMTEDFALGMELKKKKWHCRYVQAYLAVGEAPDQIRNCFQQRSRWTKVRPLASQECQQEAVIGDSQQQQSRTDCNGACVDLAPACLLFCDQSCTVSHSVLGLFHRTAVCVTLRLKPAISFSFALPYRSCSL